MIMYKNSYVGLGYRNELHQNIIEQQENIDFLEIIPEQFFSKSGHKRLEEICHSFPVIPHGVEISLGNANGMSKSHIRNIKEILNIISPPFFSEHICLSNNSAHNIGHLSPLPRTEVFLEIFCQNISKLQDQIGIPILLENITFGITFKNEYSEASFLNEICRRTGAKLLLDVTNLFINAKNGFLNLDEFIQELDFKNVKQTHIIGYEHIGNKFIDSHGEKIQEDLLDLFKTLTPKFKDCYHLIEWDRNFPEDFSIIIKETQKIKRHV